VVIKPDRSDKTESKKFFLKISDHQQRWPRPLPGAILIPPALLEVADFVNSSFLGTLFMYIGTQSRDLGIEGLRD
jgi:hypothetical protein